jgi:L-asparaginase type I
MHRKLGIIQTGGTIASIQSESTTHLAPNDIIAEFLGNEVKEYEIVFRQPYKILSENATPRHWQSLAETVAELINLGVDGIVVTHGTDTMVYTAAALSYMLRPLSIPVVLTGSMLPSNHPRWDGKKNLVWSVRAAMHPDAPHEVAIMFSGGRTSATAYYAGRNQFNDIYQTLTLDQLLIRGNRAKKVAAWPEYFTSENYAPFQSFHCDLLGAVPKDGELKINAISPSPASIPERNIAQRYKPLMRLESRVISLKISPSFQPELLVKAAEIYKGIVLEGYGDGTFPTQGEYELLDTIGELSSKGVCIALGTSLLGGASTEIYEGTHDAEKVGAIPLKDMTIESATVKLMWALGNGSMEQVRKIMHENLAGEISVKEDLVERISATKSQSGRGLIA